MNIFYSEFNETKYSHTWCGLNFWLIDLLYEIIFIFMWFISVMSNEDIIRTPDTRNIETPIINEGVLNPESKVVNKSEVISKVNLVNESSFVINKTKKTCINALNQRLYNLQKKDKIKNRAIMFTIFFSVGIIGFIAG